ncbi:GH25 family lysozyme [Clostridium beijerinckii]|uniref:Lysozyme n=1 Tax=Clostridium beijerinckii TaxID=1520 RepID=A0AAX0AZN1_CLOBE|nr:GH25 family lysozyme [Clostridium beijerinckii]NRT88520.1 GH25 family lysozyme M1 (1,4-beta-N-acetylmuramidase) [Clostridium beijerinckii]NYC73975.1 GH25 family lysozyme M1 (1,4-beta-N-acetylmuramidase) [Clostridium beijerinckii]
MKGIDISNHNGNINFDNVKAAGIEVVYIKATEGTTFKDSYLDTNYSNAHYVGLKTGFYHFLVGTSSPETQATSFYNAIKDKTSDLIPMLDVETNFDGLMDYILRFITKFKELSNMPIGIYTYTSFMDNLDNRIADYPLWEANYNDIPWTLADNFFTNRVGHQYTENGSIDGINTKCDVNEFNEGVLINSKGYVVTTYLPNAYEGYDGIDINYILSYFQGVKPYVRGNDKGVWIETQYLDLDKCNELKSTLGSWFYEIKY